MSKKYYFFDMDGTIIDSMTIAWDRVILKYLHDRNIKYPEDMISNIVTKGFMGIANYYVNELGVKENPQNLYDFFMDELQGIYDNEFEVKKGVIEALHRLKESGASLNMLSGGPHRFMDSCFKRLGIFDLFDNVWSIEDFNLSKSDVEIYLNACKRVGASVKDCTMVDDSLKAIQAAKKAGFNTVGVYEVIADKYWQEMKDTADRTIVDFAEL